MNMSLEDMEKELAKSDGSLSQRTTCPSLEKNCWLV
jgi:hypothetical protein